MKICLLTRRFALETGGIGRVSIKLRDRLRALGHKVYTVSITEEDLTHYFVHSFWRIRSKIPKDCDVYHAITPMESIWLPKNKSITSILDIIPLTNIKKHGARIGESRIRQKIAKTCFTIGCYQAAKCKKIVCISEHGRQEFVKHFNVPQEKIKVIRLGINENLNPRPKQDNTFRIGYLGQLDRRKRVDLLIKAFQRSSINGELVLAGRGFNEPELRAMASGDNRIKFLGFIPDDKLADFYNSLDYFVFPTAIEGYGLPPVEAMACKKPVIIQEDAIIPEEIKSRCISVAYLFDDLPSLLGGQIHNEPSIEDNFRFAKEHNWDVCVQEHVKLYEEIANEL